MDEERKPRKVNSILKLDTPVLNVQDIHQYMLNKWQEKWDTSTTGRRTYGFFPDIRERLSLRHINPNKGMVHYITGHDPYNETLYRLGVRNSPTCLCGEAVGTPEHVVWECTETTSIRQDIRVILGNRQMYDIVRIEALYTACENMANAVSAHFRDLYIQSLSPGP